VKPLAALAITGTALGAVLLLHARAEAATANSQPEDAATTTEADPFAGFSAQHLDVWGAIEQTIDAGQTVQAIHRQNPNLSAFLSLIAYSEGTDLVGRDPYRVCYGYRHTIQDFRDHPAVTGEWRGESLANLGPAYAGKVSTAAGRYQIIKPTWLACQRALGLVDFSPASQDAACIYLIRKRGAIEHIEAGRVAEAVRLCRPEWASLPGAGYGQPERKLAALFDAFTNAGGVLA
jgi:lysozyme